MRVLVLAAMLAGSGCTLDRGSAPARDAESASSAASGGGGHAGSGSQAAGSGAGGAGATAPWLEGFAARKRVTFQPPPLGADLADFPAAVAFAVDADLAALARPDGADLAFTTDDAVTRLSHEIESYDAATGRLTAWVRLPVLAAAGPTEVFLYYGNPGAERPADATGTWSPAFAGVWHLGDVEQGPAPQYRDSTMHANHGAPGALAAPIAVVGVAAAAVSFQAGATVVIGDPADGSLDFAEASFAYSAWIKVAGNVGEWDMPWYKGGSTPRTPGYDIELGSGGWYAWLNDGTSSGSAVSFGGEHLDQWTQLVVVVDRDAGALRSYVNGKPVATTDIVTLGSLATTLGATLGSEGYPFQGLLDELRIYATTLTPGWVLAEHANLTSADFVAVGPAEPQP